MYKCPSCDERFFVFLSGCGPMEQWGCNLCYYGITFRGEDTEYMGYTDENGQPTAKKISDKRILETQSRNYEWGGIGRSTWRRLKKRLLEIES